MKEDIFEKLEANDKKLREEKKELKNRDEEKRMEEARLAHKEEKAKIRIAKKEKVEKIKEILEDDSEGLDEPKVYKVIYSYTGGGGYGYGPKYEPGTSECLVIMTERERRIANLTGRMKEFVSQGYGYGSRCDRIIGMEQVNEQLSEEQELELNSAKRKVEIIKSSDDVKGTYLLKVRDEDSKILEVYTIGLKLGDDDALNVPIDLKRALLSSITLNNGKIEKQNVNLEITDQRHFGADKTKAEEEILEAYSENEYELVAVYQVMEDLDEDYHCTELFKIMPKAKFEIIQKYGIGFCPSIIEGRQGDGTVKSTTYFCKDRDECDEETKKMIDEKAEKIRKMSYQCEQKEGTIIRNVYGRSDCVLVDSGDFRGPIGTMVMNVSAKDLLNAGMIPEEEGWKEIGKEDTKQENLDAEKKSEKKISFSKIKSAISKVMSRSSR